MGTPPRSPACTTVTRNAAAPTAAGSGSWADSNADLANTRDATGSTISSANVSRLAEAWTFKLTGKAAVGVSAYGSLTANPIVQRGVVYLQDLDSNVYALALATGKLRWEYRCNQPEKSGPGPNGVAVAGGKVYGLTPTSAFALSATTGRTIWVNSDLLAHRRGYLRHPATGGRRAGVSGQPIRLGAGRRGAACAERVKRSGALEVQHGRRPGAGRTGARPRRRRRVGDAARRERRVGDVRDRQPVSDPCRGDRASGAGSLHRQRREPRRRDREAPLVLPGRARRLQGLRHAGLADLGAHRWRLRRDRQRQDGLRLRDEREYRQADLEGPGGRAQRP